MAIYDMEASAATIKKSESAQAAEGVAIKELNRALESGVRDESVLNALTTRFEAAHNHMMDVWKELQAFRLG